MYTMGQSRGLDVSSIGEGYHEEVVDEAVYHIITVLWI